MKTIIVTYLFIVFNIMIMTSSDIDEPCGKETNCPKKQHKYFFCLENDQSTNLIANCATDPWVMYPSYIPLTVDLPVCLEFDSNSFGNCESYSILTQTGALEILKKEYMQEDCSDSPYQWMCLCGFENKPCACTIKVKLSSDPGDFDNPTTAIACANLMKAYPASACKLDCIITKICINNTEGFTGSSPDDCYKMNQFVINDRYIRENNNYAGFLYSQKKVVYNLVEILMHEIGHIMGLHHHTITNEQGRIDKACPDNPDFSGGIMNNTARFQAGHKGNLSDDDICQFKKLYCPDLVGVNEYNTEKNKKSQPFPNPSEDITNISFSLSSYSETTILYVYNYLGNTVKILDLENLDFSNEEHIIQIPTNDLAPGQYFYKIVNETTVETGKFIIVR